MPVADVNCIEAKGNKNDLQCSIDRQNFASSIFLLILHFGLYTKLQLTSEVFLYVEQGGKFWTSNRCSDTQLWILKLLSWNLIGFHIFIRVIYICNWQQQSWLIFSYFKIGTSWWICRGENSQHSINNTRLCLYLFWQEIGTLEHSMGVRTAQTQRNTVLGKLMLQCKHYHWLSHITVHEKRASRS